jgi:glycosyltransferase involved in cell wall biosynthesis
VVSAGQALDDLWPDYPLRCRLDALEVAAVTARALADDALRARLGAEGRRRARRWSWRSAAERFLAELERVVGPRPGHRP